MALYLCFENRLWPQHVCSPGRLMGNRILDPGGTRADFSLPDRMEKFPALLGPGPARNHLLPPGPSFPARRHLPGPACRLLLATALQPELPLSLPGCSVWTRPLCLALFSPHQRENWQSSGI